MTGVDALTVSCDDCGSAQEFACRGRSTPHASRVTKARAAILDRSKRAESDWLRLAELWLDASPEQRDGMLAGARIGRAMPAGVQAVGRVLAHGAKKHGAEGVAPHWTADKVAEHLRDHALHASWRTEGRDAETGELDATHAAARGVMLAQIVEGRR